MKANNKELKIYNKRKGFIWTTIYLLSLSPIFLPWFYFDRDVDGVKYGVTFLANKFGYIILISTIILIQFIVKSTFIKKTVFCLFIVHPIIYFYLFLFWYNKNISQFSLEISLDAAHYGIYIALFVGILLCLIYYVLEIRKVGKNYEKN